MSMNHAHWRTRLAGWRHRRRYSCIDGRSRRHPLAPTESSRSEGIAKEKVAS